MIYLDAAAVVKLVRIEPESHALLGWLAERSSARRVSSSLIEVEVSRAVRRFAPTALSQVPAVLDSLHQYEIDASIRRSAASLPDPMLRSLDAIHLATALELGDELQQFVSYDRRLLAFASKAGLPVASPVPS